MLPVALPLQVVQVIADGSSQTSALELAHLVDDGGDGGVNVWLQSVVDVVNLGKHQRLGDYESTGMVTYNVLAVAAGHRARGLSVARGGLDGILEVALRL